MKRFRKTAALLLALILALGALTACGGSDDPSDSGEETPEFVYVASYATLDTDEEINYIQNCCWYNGRIYFIASVKSGTQTATEPVTTYTSATDLAGKMAAEAYEYDTYRTALFSAKEDGTDVAELTNYKMPEIPEGMEGSPNVGGMTIDGSGNIWIYENIYTYSYDVPEGFDEATQDKSQFYTEGEQQNYIRKLDPTGAELASVDISYLQGESEYFYLNYFTVDNAGNLYVSDGDGNVFVLDGSGAELFELPADGNSWLNGMVALSDGSVAAVLYDNTKTGYTLKPIDLTAKGYGEGAPAPYNVWNFYPGNGDYDFYYNTESSFYGYDIKTATGTKLITWINCDVDSNNLSSIMPLPDGRILCCSMTYNDDGTSAIELITMTKTASAEVSQKTVLTYACMYLDWNIRSQIIKFNKTNPDFRIEVQDYSEYNTNEDYTAGLTKLSTEIISGKIPDILYTNNLPIRQYAAKGLLEDLWPYIDADTELGGRDALVTPVFNALQQDGKLYQISPSFSVYTVIGASSVVGEEPGWTLDELYAALETLPEGAEIFSMGTVKSDILYQCCALGMDKFVNWDTGECTFDSPEFIKLLEFSNQFPETFDWDKIDWESGDYEDESTRIAAGKQMLSIFYASDFQSYQMYKAMYGGDVTFIGFPTESRDGSAFQVDTGLALSSGCKNKDGAWQFIRTLLTEDYQEQNVWSFPTNQNIFDQKLTEAMTPIYTTDPVTGEQVEQSRGGWGMGSLTVDMYALTQEEADQLMELIESTDRVYSYDENLMKIINEEAAAFFAGQKSAEDTAAMIQSRIALYVNEQR